MKDQENTMGVYSTDPLFEDFALAFGELGGQRGELTAASAGIADGDDAGWNRSFSALADRLCEEADGSLAAGHPAGARHAYLRASVYYSVGYHPLYGSPMDPALKEGFRRQTVAFAKAAALADPPGESVEIPYEGTTLPGWLFRPAGGGDPRPLLIATDGYDSTLYEMYLATVVPTLERGISCLIFDGPGQGRALFEQGLFIRPDWENVVRPVVDLAVQLPGIDPNRIALTGWSLGGYLALRAATAEHRIAACIADPGLYSMDGGMVPRLTAAGIPPAALAGYPDLASDILSMVESGILASRAQKWAIMQRGFMVHGVDSLQEYLKTIAAFTVKDRLGDITCPTLVCAAENDPLSASAPTVLQQLKAPATFLQFLASEGAGDHCEMSNRPLFNQRSLDWLEDIFATR
jgi:pimeloyl-ACP methyl ester carboxylesterase